MELNKPGYFLTNKKFIDIELIFSNGTHQVALAAHKFVLASNCEYFNKMFNCNGDITTTAIIVDEPDVARDVILSFYGIKSNSKNYPKWRYILEVLKTRHFFCLDNDVNKLYNLIVPTEGSDLFLEVASQFDIATDQKLIKSIKRNLPAKYDLVKLSDPFIKLLQKKNYKIISGSDDSTIKIWDADYGSLLHTLTGHTDCVCSVTISRDGLRIISVSDDKTIRIWDASNGSLIHTLTNHNHSDLNVAISPNGLRIVSGSNDNTIKIRDAVDGSLLRILTGHTNSVWSVAYSPDGLQIVSGSWDNTIRIWDATNGSLLHTLIGHTGCVYSVAYSPDSLRIVSGSYDGTIKIWDAVDCFLIRTLTNYTGSGSDETDSVSDETEPVMSIAISPDGLRIVSGSNDGTIKIWDAVNESLLRTLTGHKNTVLNVAFSSDGLQIVSGSWDKTIKIWDTTNGSLVHTLRDHTAPVMSVAFSS